MASFASANGNTAANASLPNRSNRNSESSEPLLPLVWQQSYDQSTSNGVALTDNGVAMERTATAPPTTEIASNTTQSLSAGLMSYPAVATLSYVPMVGKNQPQRMPKRTTKTSQKLTLFPEGGPAGADVADFDNAQDCNQIPQLPHVTAKTIKERWLTKLERKWLPRVTAYCTANTYKMDALMDHLKQKEAKYHISPKRIDEVIYTPFNFSETDLNAPDLIDIRPVHDHIQEIGTLLNPTVGDVNSFFDQNIDASGKSIPGNIPYENLAKRIAPIGEVLYFDYGVVVMWGLTESEEHIILDDLERFEEENLPASSIETEQFYFHYNTFYQPRIYNDIITLRNPANFMLKITISHAIAQSVKLTLFEGLIEETIESTKHVPQIMAEEGKIHMSRTAINKKIGQLFIMRINVNLVSNVLDTPEIFWSEPPLEPLYMAIRGYLEISQRVELLNQRVSVISDLLDMLKEHLNSSHGEQLEWIVIILIAFEIIIGIITITVDLSSFVKHS
ncbi:hypothetical protein BATDEDRAFT_36144 [Batrachochytrium dendrobatidis JAM81]|uniref:DUF155 domain-containing protein n=1 Tax=Batrachochytrium dendrobatidis (strain JAM81 / FGSC 10211) TaxID=684364 RepID=F4PCK6_BATDJ|nr:uncharacterized protein BATDEDRAFT_36144 [Batrachochytrium dendrobatidis JAM81]EGF76844.1 hypothetical protein BATDEDRAFT_36144 [Batrachochytrium dendrobatidis JAM81]KAJ8331002.1 sporulation protein rmd1 [Batrachochytrium dendrobatidis]KAK5672430.1 sporulation protein rmd1 [Batrachochytrium dendrobatidis]|eukprot:XP_006682446.1 hypothetical protein BATDEDRAFT_36144 [Batrachochytrium dendrobatidis JAM81]